MNITEEQVRYVATLANLNLTDSEIQSLSKDMAEILTHMQALSEVDTENVEPMTQVTYDSDETATLRPDRPWEPLGNAAALANAPASGKGYYKVPKVIER